MKFLLLSLLVHFAVFPANEKPSFVKEKSSSTKIASAGILPISDRKWEMQEIRFLYDNQRYYYQRDNYTESNMNFDNDNIIFNCGGIGIYHQSDNIEYPLKWHFIENKKNAIEFTISKFRDNSDLLVNWENIELSANSIKYTEYYTHKNGLHCLGYGIRIAKAPGETGTDMTAANRDQH